MCFISLSFLCFSSLFFLIRFHCLMETLEDGFYLYEECSKVLDISMEIHTYEKRWCKDDNPCYLPPNEMYRNKESHEIKIYCDDREIYTDIQE